MTDGHHLAIDMMLAGVEEIETFGRLGQVEASLIRRQRGIVLRFTDFQKIEKISIRQPHLDDEVAGLTPDFFDGDQVGMADVAKGGNGANFFGGGQALSAGKKF